jgi:hypothetical protein
LRFSQREPWELLSSRMWGWYRFADVSVGSYSLHSKCRRVGQTSKPAIYLDHVFYSPAFKNPSLLACLLNSLLSLKMEAEYSSETFVKSYWRQILDNSILYLYFVINLFTACLMTLFVTHYVASNGRKERLRKICEGMSISMRRFDPWTSWMRKWTAMLLRIIQAISLMYVYTHGGPCLSTIASNKVWGAYIMLQEL